MDIDERIESIPTPKANKDLSEANISGAVSRSSARKVKSRLEDAVSRLEDAVAKKNIRVSSGGLKSELKAAKRQIKELEKHNLTIASRLDSVIDQVKKILGE